MIIDNPALGLDSVIFGSFSCISLDSIMDSIDSSQIPLLIGRGRRRRVEGAEGHPRRRLLLGWGSRGHAFNSGLAGQMARSRDADADRCAVGGESVILSTRLPMAPLFSALSSSFLVMPSHLSHLADVHSRPFDPAAVLLECPFVSPRG